MPYITSADARQKLMTIFAQEAFDKLDALGPRWVCVEDEPDQVYLSPTIETKRPGSTVLSSPLKGWAKTFDEAVLANLSAIQEAAQLEGTLIIANAYKDNRAEFTYDKTARAFIECNR